MKNKENKWTPGRAPAQPREAARGRQRTPPEAREGARSGLPGCPRRCPTGPCVLKETGEAQASVLRAPCGCGAQIRMCGGCPGRATGWCSRAGRTEGL